MLEYFRERSGPNGSTLYEGRLPFNIAANGANPIASSYELLIEVPKDFPNGLPKVFETDNEIPREPSYHVNADGSICLATPLRMLRFLKREPSLDRFVEQFVLPYLYGVALKTRHGGEMPFGELPHGSDGLLEDYKNLFGVKDDQSVVRYLECLTLNKRRANRLWCPCGCGRRLGQCSTRWSLNQMRETLPPRSTLLKEFRVLKPKQYQTGKRIRRKSG